MKYCSNCRAAVVRRIPAGDNRERWVCDACDIVHYENPKVVVGCVPEHEGRILLCKRAIEPRYGFWTVPAGFMELGETVEQGAARETREEACAEVEMGRLFAVVDVLEAGQVHLFFKATLMGGYGAGEESLEAALFAKDDIPWDEIAFLSGRYALEKYLEDDGRDRGVHLHRVRHGE